MLEPEPQPEPEPELEPEALAEPSSDPNAEPNPKPESVQSEEATGTETGNPSDQVGSEKVQVIFILTPEDAELLVFSKMNPDDPEEKTEIEAEEDGSYLLLPGEYYYTLKAEGYTEIEEEKFEATASDEHPHL